MKKILLILTILLIGASTVTAQVRYKGYVDLQGGVMVPPGNSDHETGPSFGISTSHGVELFGGLFLGAGLDITGHFYSYDVYNSDETETDAGAFINVFADVRYNFLRGRKVSPFVGTRIGGGWQSFDEAGVFLFNPSVGVTFNFTKRFGLDVGLNYKLNNTTTDDYIGSGRYRTEVKENCSYHNIAISVGVHF